MSRELRASILAPALAAALSSGGTLAAGQAAPAKPQPPKTLRLYVFDCGVLDITKEGVERYHVTAAEVGETRMP